MSLAVKSLTLGDDRSRTRLPLPHVNNDVNNQECDAPPHRLVPHQSVLIRLLLCHSDIPTTSRESATQPDPSMPSPDCSTNIVHPITDAHLHNPATYAATLPVMQRNISQLDEGYSEGETRSHSDSEMTSYPDMDAATQHVLSLVLALPEEQRRRAATPTTPVRVSNADM